MTRGQVERFVQLVHELGQLRAQVRQPPSEAEMACCAVQCSPQDASDAVIAALGMLYVVCDKPIGPFVETVGVCADILGAMAEPQQSRAVIVRALADYFETKALSDDRIDRLLNNIGLTRDDLKPKPGQGGN